MVTMEALRNVRFVIDSNGKQAAVQVSMDDWRAILEYFEELEDRAVIKELLKRLNLGPQKSGALDWQEAREQW